MSGGTGRHDSDPIKLLKIYEIYAEWLEYLYPIEEQWPPKLKKSLPRIRDLVSEANTQARENLVNELAERVELGKITEARKTKILQEYDKALLDQAAEKERAIEERLWPKIVYGPVTLASDQYHTVLLILDPETAPKQERYVSKRFFNLIKWSWTRHDDILEPEWIEDYLEPLARELEGKGLTRIQ
jgi:hypothetical protein